jgi:hypothetical protein
MSLIKETVLFFWLEKLIKCFAKVNVVNISCKVNHMVSLEINSAIVACYSMKAAIDNV